MGKTKQLLNDPELTWIELDEMMEAYFEEQEAKFYNQRNETLNELSKEQDETNI